MRSVLKRWFLRRDTEVEDVTHCISHFKRENTHYDLHTHADTEWRAQRDHQRLVFLLLWKPCPQKRQDGWVFIGRTSLFTSEQGLAGRGWARARSTWTVTDPNSPLQLLGRTMHHRSLLPPTLQPQSPRLPSLHALSRCLFSQIVTKGRGRREQYLFTTWWHHL